MMQYQRYRPVCLNHGCNKLVTWSRQTKDKTVRYKPHCSRCAVASYDSTKKLAPGVTPFRTGYCSNRDGHLGWNCPCDWSDGSVAIGITEIDHIDGNPNNNVPENTQELCPICHKVKGKLCGDYSNDSTRYRINNPKINLEEEFT